MRNFRRQLGAARCFTGPENTVGDGARLATRRELRGHLPSILLLLSSAFAVALHCVVPTSFYMLDVIRRPPEPLAYLCIAVLLAGSLAPAVDRAPSGRRCWKQMTRLCEQYTFLQSTGWATPVSPWTSPPDLMISAIIRRPRASGCLSILSDASPGPWHPQPTALHSDAAARAGDPPLGTVYSPPAPEPLACLCILSDASETRLSLLAISSMST